jgi:hypothetical protein
MRLEDHEAIFQQLKEFPESKAWLDKHLTFRNRVFMVVGLMISTDAKIERTEERGKENTFSTKIEPGKLAEILGGLPSSLPSEEVANIELAIKSMHSQQVRLKATAGGEAILAVEFRVIEKSKLGFGKEVKLRGAPRFKGLRKFTGGNGEDTDEDGEPVLSEKSLGDFM